VLLAVIAHSDVCDLCWWCCCAMVWLCYGVAGRLGFLGRPISLTVTHLYCLLSSGALTPPYMHLVIEQLVSWLACPAKLVPVRYFDGDSC
jgi:hypothetical protein